MSSGGCPKTPELLSLCQGSRTPSPMPTMDSAAAGAEPERLKSDVDETKAPSDGRNTERPERPDSPEEQCSICLGSIENMSHTDVCHHSYCFTCLVEWSKVNPVCPLCKKGFKSIIHTIHSEHDYKSYRLPERPVERRMASDADFEILYQSELDMNSRIRQFEHLVAQWRQREVGFPLMAAAFDDYALPAAFSSSSSSRRRLATSDFRRSVYERHLFVRPESVVDQVTGRYRESSPAWYRDNPAQTHRLVPWLNRELAALTAVNHQRIPHVLQLILEFIQRYPIMSAEFRMEMEPYIGSRTTHFQHEFHHFARSVYDIVGYDREAQYGPPPAPPPVETLVVSSDSSENEDEAGPSSNPAPGPSGSSDAFSSLPSTSSGQRPRTSMEPILIPSSAEEDENDVEVIKHVKQMDRTPVIIDIQSSDEESPSHPDNRERLSPLDAMIDSLPTFDSFSKSSRRSKSTVPGPSSLTSADTGDHAEHVKIAHSSKGKGKGKSSKGIKVKSSRNRPLSPPTGPEEEASGSAGLDIDAAVQTTSAGTDGLANSSDDLEDRPLSEMQKKATMTGSSRLVMRKRRLSSETESNLDVPVPSPSSGLKIKLKIKTHRHKSKKKKKRRRVEVDSDDELQEDSERRKKKKRKKSKDKERSAKTRGSPPPGQSGRHHDEEEASAKARTMSFNGVEDDDEEDLRIQLNRRKRRVTVLQGASEAEAMSDINEIRQHTTHKRSVRLVA